MLKSVVMKGIIKWPITILIVLVIYSASFLIFAQSITTWWGFFRFAVIWFCVTIFMNWISNKKNR